MQKLKNLLKFPIQLLNRLIYKPYTDLDIPAKKFFRTLDKGDLRHLLKCKKLPIYKNSWLIPTYEKIFDEYSQLMNNSAYKDGLNKETDKLRNRISNNLLLIGYDLLLLRNEWAFQFLKDAGIIINDFSVESVNKVKSKILSEINIHNIEKIRNKIQEPNTNKTFEQIAADVQLGLGFAFNNDITLADFCAYANALNSKIDAEKKQIEKLKNGR